MSIKLGVVSAKGGVGKTTTAINLATSLYDFNQEVTLVDANMLNPDVSLQLDLPQPTISLQNVLNAESDIHRAIKAHHSGLKIVPSSISFDEKEVNISQLNNALNKLDGTVVIDSPSGTGDNARRIIESSDAIIVVTTPDLPAVADSAKTIKLAKKMNKPVLGVITNRVRNDAYELTKDEIEIICEATVISNIPEDNDVRRSQFESMAVVRYNPYAKATIAFNYLAARLLNKSYKPPDFLSIRRFFRF